MAIALSARLPTPRIWMLRIRPANAPQEPAIAAAALAAWREIR